MIRLLAGALLALAPCSARAVVAKSRLMLSREAQLFRPSSLGDDQSLTFYRIRGRWTPAALDDRVPRRESEAYRSAWRSAQRTVNHLESVGYEHDGSPIPVLVELRERGKGAGKAMVGGRVVLRIGPELRRDLANASSHETVHVVLRRVLSKIRGHALSGYGQGTRVNTIHEAAADYFAAASIGRGLSFRNVRERPDELEHEAHSLGHELAHGLWRLRVALARRGVAKQDVDRAVLAAIVEMRRSSSPADFLKTFYRRALPGEPISDRLFGRFLETVGL